MKIKNLEYFIGKPCTIFTHPINRNFKEENPNSFIEQPFHYFVGVIDQVDEHGILVTQIFTGLKSYFFMNGLISISEESTLDPENEADAQIINEMVEKNAEVREQYKVLENKSDYVNPDAMTDLLKNINQKNK